jgi:hypothetical protein
LDIIIWFAILVEDYVSKTENEFWSIQYI